MNFVRGFLCATAISFFSLTCSAGKTLNFDSLDPAHPYSVSGELFLTPKAIGAVPAVVVIHGSGGKDERTEFFVEELPKHGIATFVVDYKTAIFHTPSDRPPNDTFVAATYAALKLLQSRSEIIAEKIGVMGFALGGQQTLSATLPKFKRMWIGEMLRDSVSTWLFILDVSSVLESSIRRPTLKLRFKSSVALRMHMATGSSARS